MYYSILYYKTVNAEYICRDIRVRSTSGHGYGLYVATIVVSLVSVLLKQLIPLRHHKPAGK